MQIKKNGKEVIETGSILGKAGETIEFNIGSPGSPYFIRIYFSENEDDKPGTRVEFFGQKSDVEIGCKITINKYDNPLGSTTASPILIAEGDGNPIYLALSVHGIGSDYGLKLFSFTIFRG